MTVFQAKRPAEEDLRTLLATRTKQSVRCTDFGRAITDFSKWLTIFWHFKYIFSNKTVYYLTFSTIF